MSARRSQGLPGTKQTNLTIPYRDQSLMLGSPPLLTKTYNTRSIGIDGNYPYKRVVMEDVLGVDKATPFSVTAWEKMITVGVRHSHIIASKSNVTVGWFFFRDLDGRIECRLRGNGTSNEIRKYTSSTFAYDEWVHCAFTYNGNGDETGLNLYGNGVLSASTAPENALGAYDIANSEAVALYNWADGGFGWSKASRITEIVFWTGLLTPAQISMVYRHPDPRVLPFADMIGGYWSGDGSDETIVLDYSGNGYHGTPLNMDASNFYSDAPTPT